MKEIEDITYDYVIGADREIKHIFKNIDMGPLFKTALNAGARNITLEDAEGCVLYRQDTDSLSETSCSLFTFKKNLFLEGEAVAHITVTGAEEHRNSLEITGGLLYEAVDIILKSSYRTLLATETHKTVVYQSYEELLETNRKLMESESKYRDLADSLEKQVQQRTEELKRAHARLLHQEKIASVGQLAAGVAHEINNPLGFIASNINTLRLYVSKMKDMLLSFREVSAKGVITDEEREALIQKWMKQRFDVIFADIEDLLTESSDGAERVKKIVSDLKGFSHIDEINEIDIDINREIDRTLNVLTHEIPAGTDIVRDYQPVPLLLCNPADICQALFNIIQNAIQVKTDGLGIVISTRSINGQIRIDISDNGPGMPEEITNRIFEPFFTTKEVGKGTGMGLNVTHEIVSSYGGSIEVESRPGEGAKFSILLPVKR